jgi:drug/metabolite transporter (DMT)-like permease
MNISKAGYGLLAALLFGASTPLAKISGKHVEPIMLAGLLYLGSGVGLMIAIAIFGLERFKWFKLGDLTRGQATYLGGAIFFGGMLAPILLMSGLTRVDGSTASLLLNLEGALTALIACMVFHERYGTRLKIGLVFIVAGGVALTLQEKGNLTFTWLGTFFIAAACACWALDNNFTKQVAFIEAPVLAALKGLAAGVVNVCLALVVGQRLPAAGQIAISASIGFIGYGLSLVFFILSLRRIGTARTSAYFSTAPFVGAILSLAILREQLGLRMAIAGGLMAVGVYLHLTEDSTNPV